MFAVLRGKPNIRKLEARFLISKNRFGMEPFLPRFVYWGRDKSGKFQSLIVAATMCLGSLQRKPIELWLALGLQESAPFPASERLTRMLT